MEFKKINEDKFQCLLYEEDLEYNNITLDDFFRNDTEKIHNLLEVIMDEAHKNIGVELGGGVMSLQLAPQPDHSILLTVSSGKEDFGNMLKQAGERAAKALGDRSKSESNVIKNGGEDLKAPEFAAFDKLKDIFDQMKYIPEAEKYIFLTALRTLKICVWYALRYGELPMEYIRRTTGIILCLRREDVPGNAITQYVML